MAWLGILRHAPAILAAAEALLARSKAGGTGDHLRSVDARLDELADASRASAAVVQEMAKQLHALAIAQQTAVRRMRIAIGVSAAAGVLAASALVIALVR
jgi:hypothetical protein